MDRWPFVSRRTSVLFATNQRKARSNIPTIYFGLKPLEWVLFNPVLKPVQLPEEECTSMADNSWGYKIYTADYNLRGMYSKKSRDQTGRSSAAFSPSGVWLLSMSMLPGWVHSSLQGDAICHLYKNPGTTSDRLVNKVPPLLIPYFKELLTSLFWYHLQNTLILLWSKLSMYSMHSNAFFATILHFMHSSLKN